MHRTGPVLLALVALTANAQTPPPAPARGELLYATHCQGCHSTQVHWRDKKLASDWASLAAQVERWQKSAQLGWSDEDIEAVARYLNRRFYRFPAPPGDTPIGTRPGPSRVGSAG